MGFAPVHCIAVLHRTASLDPDQPQARVRKAVISNKLSRRVVGSLREAKASHETLHWITVASTHHCTIDHTRSEVTSLCSKCPAQRVYVFQVEDRARRQSTPLSARLHICDRTSQYPTVRSQAPLRQISVQCVGRQNTQPRSQHAFAKSMLPLAGLFGGEPGFSGLKLPHSRRDPAGANPSQKVAALLRRWKSTATGRSRPLVEEV